MARRLGVCLLTAALVAAADLWTKHAVWRLLPGPYDREVVWSDPDGDPIFEIVHHTNTGGMWGVGRDWNPWILRIFRLLSVGVVFWLLFQVPREDRLSHLALGLVLGGATGNIYDSLRFGHVRDFLKFDFDVPVFDPFPTFNVADSAITVGVALLAFRMLFPPRKRTHPAKPARSGGAIG